jgi:hypothetical protein
MIGPGNIVERVFLLYMGKEMEKRLEKILLRTNAVVPRKMVAYQVCRVALLERNHKTVFRNVPLNCVALLDRQNLTIEVIDFIRLFLLCQPIRWSTELC